MKEKQIIGIMGAMPEEVDSIRAHMTDVKEVDHGNRKYYVGKIHHHDVVLVFSRWGKVASAATTTSLITEFNITQLIFTGVAAAASSDLNIGDIVISDRLYQHDMDASPIFQRYQIPLTDLTFMSADDALKKKAHRTVGGLLESLTQKIPADSLTRFEITSPRCCFGLIGTGDQFVSNHKTLQALVEDVPDLMAVEMEGGAVAQVCHDYHIPFVVIRTISDKADHSACVDFSLFIREVARYYSEHIVLGMLA